MMGTSLLAMPWGVAKAGLVMSCLVAAGFGMIACSTAILVLHLHKKMSKRF